MANPYYTPSGNPGTTAPGASSPIRAEYAAISAGFDKLPPLVGNANYVVAINSAATGMTVIPGLTYTMNSFTVGFIANGDATIRLPTGNVTLATTADVTAGVATAIPPGGMMDDAGATAPAGWLLCNGQVVNRITYANLFAAISTAFNTGGEAGTDFRLPDLCGRVTAGLDNMGGITAKGRLTTASMSPNAITMGAIGGTQQNTATTTINGSTSTGVSFTSGGTAFTNGLGGTAFTAGVGVDVALDANSVGGLQFGGGGLASQSGDHSSGTISGNAGISVSGNSTVSVSGGGTFGGTHTGTGTSSAFNVVQPTVLVNKIIKI